MTARLSQLAPLPDIKNVRLGETLGQGSFALVKKGFLVGQENQIFAVKFVHRKNAELKGLKTDDLAREVILHKSCSQHPNIIRLVEYGLETDWMWIAMQLASGGDLFDKIEPDIGVNPEIAHFFFKQLISALEYMHTQNVAHRDIKPENILLDSRGNLKLTDFGLACPIRRKDGTAKRVKVPAGSPPYMAPEVAYRGGYLPNISDVWSCGVVLYVLLTGETPWEEPTERDPEFVFYIQNEGKVLSGAWGRIEPFALSLLRKMLHPDPEQRLTVDQVVKHPWFSKKNTFMNSQGLCCDAEMLVSRLMANLKVGLDDQEYISCTQTESYQPKNEVMFTQPVVDMANIVDDIYDHRVLATQQYFTEHSRQPLANDDRIFDLISKDPATQQFYNGSISMSQFSQRVPSQPQMKKFVSDRLTRFFTMYEAETLLPIIYNALTTLGVPASTDILDHGNSLPVDISVSTLDKNKLPLRGFIRVSRVNADGAGGLKTVQFIKSKCDPLEWRRFFKRVTVLCREAVYY